RVRFLNLLSELGENSVVLLSTHIVEDVTELCTRMAIIDGGEILLEAAPLEAVEDLRGRIWRRVIAKHELGDVEREHAVISTKLLAGRTVVHVYGDAPPGFEPAEPALEDVYFSAMAGQIGRRAAVAVCCWPGSTGSSCATRCGDRGRGSCAPSCSSSASR